MPWLDRHCHQRHFLGRQMPLPQYHGNNTNPTAFWRRGIGPRPLRPTSTITKDSSRRTYTRGNGSQLASLVPEHSPRVWNGAYEDQFPATSPRQG
ncbi:hypothetical protein CH63R_07006 [Colletotrichum higginsianum IMI 349063]|uniref:Uncharacterized protein n=1 Tax=Colletotrichum higginsianum (strain IMI 349063) TaxID=759273 RepID=A0A1B7Y860_COLHI|nr:hypothetical protein CH63R_07006 [Colletotrichum higginsianum IMI 349063]OBR08241.1 hypothetical protein CH63R_07006 [Colletotrichum higginsianum IMI 349063]